MTEKSNENNKSSTLKSEGLPKKLIEGVHYYLNKDGFMVFTSEYHLARGFCCENGCKHCPYGYKKG